MKKQSFENLISLAQQELPPGVDVANGVIMTLSSLARQQRDPYRAYAWASAVSMAAAACILVALTVFHHESSDSVSEIISYVSWISQ